MSICFHCRDEKTTYLRWTSEGTKSQVCDNCWTPFRLTVTDTEGDIVDDRFFATAAELQVEKKSILTEYTADHAITLDEWSEVNDSWVSMDVFKGVLADA